MKRWLTYLLRNFRLVVYVLVICVAGLPLQAFSIMDDSAQSVEGKVVESNEDAIKTLDSQSKTPVNNEESSEESEVASAGDSETEQEKMSTMGKVGIAAGAVAVVGVALALGGGSSGSSAPPEPPTAEHLVSAWSASASSADSRSYTGKYHLYNGGALGYDLNLSDGTRKVGGGHWSISGYELTLRNDTGTVYSGTFAPGNTTSITLHTNVGWTLELSR
ncbi:MAG: hypothetical protein ACN4GW_04220 [Desulforhopalus sp.]